MDKDILSLLNNATETARVSFLIVFAMDKNMMGNLRPFVIGKTNGEYKRIIRRYRIIQSIARRTGKLEQARMCDDAIAFVRRELMRKEAVA